MTRKILAIISTTLIAIMTSWIDETKAKMLDLNFKLDPDGVQSPTLAGTSADVFTVGLWIKFQEIPFSDNRHRFCLGFRNSDTEGEYKGYLKFSKLSGHEKIYYTEKDNSGNTTPIEIRSVDNE